ncbi:MAG: ketopantoate reductase family protein [Janthinobacterium lividum]
MRFLVIGAGALGGYFGARLLEAGQDVTFLLRERRAAQLQETGLVVRSPFGAVHWPAPPWVTREQLQSPYDVVIVGCKAYDLAETIAAFAPAVGPDTLILPVLNGLAHIDALRAAFGDSNVLGGYCLISAALDARGEIHHLNDTHTLVFGVLNDSAAARVDELARAFSTAKCDARASAKIIDEMWAKWVQIATAAGMTCLMRASIGEIISAGGTRFAQALLNEAAAIAAANRHPLSDAAMQRIRRAISDPGSAVTASMLKDLERGGAIEADHLIGDLLARRPAAGDAGDAGDADADAAAPPSLLDLVYLHLRVYTGHRPH